MSGSYDPEKPEFEAAPDPLEKSLEQDGLGLTPETAPPVYKMMPDSRIPVSSKRGGVWRSRRDQAQKAMEKYIESWDDAIQYYNHDQQDHRNSTGGRSSATTHLARGMSETFSTTENIVFANVTAQVPELYAKNPIVSVSATPTLSEEVDETVDAFARCLQKLIDVIFAMKFSPGVNIKPKAKKNVLVALLTNMAWFETGYIKRDMSSDQAMTDLMQLSNELAAAKDDKVIREIEGKLQALEQKIEFLQPSGPTVRIHLPHEVLTDGNRQDPYLNDCNWVIIGDLLSTEYINAVYFRAYAHPQQWIDRRWW
jgi:predicted transcriptional regulator